VTVVGKEAADKFIADQSSDNLKLCFSGLMNANKSVIANALESLRKKLAALGV